jgi:hypothetical protein
MQQQKQRYQQELGSLENQIKQLEHHIGQLQQQQLQSPAPLGPFHLLQPQKQLQPQRIQQLHQQYIMPGQQWGGHSPTLSPAQRVEANMQAQVKEQVLREMSSLLETADKTEHSLAIREQQLLARESECGRCEAEQRAGLQRLQGRRNELDEWEAQLHDQVITKTVFLFTVLFFSMAYVVKLNLSIICAVDQAQQLNDIELLLQQQQHENEAIQQDLLIQQKAQITAEETAQREQKLRRHAEAELGRSRDALKRHEEMQVTAAETMKLEVEQVILRERRNLNATFESKLAETQAQSDVAVANARLEAEKAIENVTVL